MQVRIEWVYKKKKGPSVTFFSEEMKAQAALLVAEDLEKTGRVKEIQFIDGDHQTWSVKEMKKFIEGIQTEPHDAVIYFDGGYDIGNHQAGLGAVIYYQQNHKTYRLRTNAGVDEMESNNEAEYAALHFALRELEQLGVQHQEVTIKGDSQVVINQLKDEWPVMEEGLSKWADRVENHMKMIGVRPSYELISRKQNKEADRLASQALEKVEVRSTKEIEN
ncbi:reverse transcriptase-like protein [Halobacillus litoralis]|uniref:reverse transcriptase-like protein n=1 Tax=Halobacillus litoralis TaxID=45668 RepID=UPI001CD7F140|nr:reverse transcriptase-like protein [Halobacillus litoralis]MCA0969531.1 reverse transcriptase-like protein [Halobacillus litoralis]